MSDVKIYRVPQFMSKRVNVICVDGVPVCTVRGKKSTSDIIAKLSGYDVNICDGRINKISNRINKEESITFIDATEGGTRIKGTEILTMEKAIDKYSNKNIRKKMKLLNELR